MSPAPPPGRRPRVVIVGAGFGGLAAARALARAPVEVALIDRRNYHLFQPLLYQVATAALSPADIAWPIRAILRQQANARVQLGRVTGVDTARARGRRSTRSRRVPYDYLVLATGARHAYFGRDEWASVAPGLKKIDDATAIRQRDPDRLRARRGARTTRPSGGACSPSSWSAAARPASRWPAPSPSSRATRSPRDFRAIDPTPRPRGPGRGRAAAARRPSPSGSRPRRRRALERLGVEVLLGAPVHGLRRGGRGGRRRAPAGRDRRLGGGRRWPRRPRAGSAPRPTARAGSWSAPTCRSRAIPRSS